MNVVEVLNQFPFEVDTGALLSRVHVREGSADAKDLHDLVESVRDSVRPKAMYRVSYVESRDGDEVCIDGVAFSSRVLSANLREVQRVFPYIATCGKELEALDIASDDFTRIYWVDTIKGMALHASVEYLLTYLSTKYILEKTATMSPGAAEKAIWPIEQQKQLFSLFGGVEDAVGVKLTESLVMVPSKSVSGILFPTEVNFKSCQVCQRENCPSRAAAFDRELMRSYGRIVEEGT